MFEQDDGYRYQAFATNTASGQLAFLEARHRAHARVEDRIKNAKDTGLGRLPYREYAISHVWVQIVAVAADLTAWLRLLALDNDLAAAEPKALGSGCSAWPTDPRRRKTPPPAPAVLAMGRPDRRSVPANHDHARTHLNNWLPEPTTS